jgi:hypothetical protein
MKRVYRVDFDLTDFGLLAVDGELSDYLDLLTLDGTSKADVWVPPPVFAPYPRRRRPDLWHLLGCATLVCGGDVARMLEPHFSEAGEVLPLPFEDDVLSLLNITEDLDCLDPAQSYDHRADGKYFGIPDRYVFHAHRLPGPMLFKIPQTDVAEVLCNEDSSSSGGFRALVENYGLTGILFELLWEGLDEPESPGLAPVSVG